MNPLSVLKMRTVDSRTVGATLHSQEYANPKSQPISLLSVLEAENIRLRQSVVELSLDTLVLREALNELRPAAKSWISGRVD
jgi:hypothetical protein